VRGALIAVALVACSAAPEEYAGVGPWVFGKTTLRHATGRCIPEDLALYERRGSYCTLQPPLKIAGRPSDVDLYFDGEDPASRLVEIRIYVRGCDEEKTLAFFRSILGEPVGTAGAKVFHHNRHLFAAITAPSEPGRCKIRMVPAGETAAIAKLRAP
jgi:hypothetical protein